MEVSGQLHAPVALPPGKEPPVTHWIGGCVGPRAGLDAVVKKKISLRSILMLPFHLILILNDYLQEIFSPKGFMCLSPPSQPYTYLIIASLLACLLTYLPMAQDIFWKADSHSACQTIDFFLYRTRRFITVFTNTRHCTLSWVSWIQFVPPIPMSLRSILILSSSPTSRSSQWSLAFGPPYQNPLNTSLLPLACPMSRPPHSPWFNHHNNIR